MSKKKKKETLSVEVLSDADIVPRKRGRPKGSKTLNKPLNEEQTIQLKDVLKDLPMDLVENLPTLVSRLNAFITFYSALNLKRLNNLTSYVIKAEEVLFDEKNLINMDYETLQKNYAQAKSATIEILDLARKVSVQLQQDSVNKDVDEVYRLLKGLSPDSLEELKEKLMSLKDN